MAGKKKISNEEKIITIARTKISKVKGYKAFENDLTCRGFQYEIGKEYKLPDGEKLEICKSGFHFCKTIGDCYDYYPMDGDTRVCEIEALGNIVAEEDDAKFVTDHIKIVKEVTDQNIVRCNSGNRNFGFRNSGNSNSGNHNSGDNNSGDGNSGNRNSGYRNSDYSNTGNYNTGSFNSGSYNSGSYNSGSSNSGNHNSGTYNSGFHNSGFRNSGDFNSGSYNSGCFCTDQIPKIKMFDKESDWTMNDWLESKTALILSTMPYDVIKWVSFLDMTDIEKKEHPEAEIAGGYLKEIEVTDDERQKWWDELSDDSKNEILSLPNFDPKKFKICTGIDVWQSFNQLSTDDDNNQDCNTTEDTSNTIFVNEPKIMNQSADSYSVMEEDGLYLYTPIPSGTPGLCTKRKIMDKETFIKCYNEWIVPKNPSLDIIAPKKYFVEFNIDISNDDPTLFNHITGPSVIEYYDDGTDPYDLENPIKQVSQTSKSSQYSIKIPCKDKWFITDNTNHQANAKYAQKAIKMLMEYLMKDDN